MRRNNFYRNKPKRRGKIMYLDNLPKRKVSELKQEFYRLRQIDKPSYWDLMKWMEVYSELSFRGVEP
tara:strand:- start:400 stop:600 length:201 start_codon:yes stop_codon:yes gene_type:complete